MSLPTPTSTATMNPYTVLAETRTANHSAEMQRLSSMPRMRDITIRARAFASEHRAHRLTFGSERNRVALLAFTRGIEVPQPCASCRAAHGPFDKCVVVDGFFLGSCTNCRFNKDASRCDLRAPEHQGRRTFRGPNDSGRPHGAPITTPNDTAHLQQRINNLEQRVPVDANNSGNQNTDGNPIQDATFFQIPVMNIMDDACAPFEHNRHTLSTLSTHQHSMLAIYYTQSIIVMNTLNGVWEGNSRLLDNTLSAEFRVLDYLKEQATEKAAEEEELRAALAAE